MFKIFRATRKIATRIEVGKKNKTAKERITEN